MFKNRFPFLFRKNNKTTEEYSSISSLAAKTLTNSEDIEKIQTYLHKLNDAIKTKGINNIAITGSYGSGKSTIINTFKDIHNENEYLNISLASFNKKNGDINDGIDEKKSEKVKREELGRLLEVSILQQIFYHVKPSEIPESRFKRIINIPTWKLWLISSFLILWVSSLVLLIKYRFLDKINPSNWHLKDSVDWLSIVIFLITFSGIGYFSKSIIELFSNSKINKVNIRGELELGENVNKSVFNEHLEEILYFFEKTKFNVVIIEDLDRFDNTDIFTKLREINILLNNSKLINRDIKFVYAVGDDLFNDKKERVKFFEFIVPVIPFINSTNADDQLKKLLNEEGLDDDFFPKEFLSDITTFIDDIDMRLLISIFHEFIIYRNALTPEFVTKPEELFAIITYKNIDPEDFNKLNSKSGKLYNLISQKSNYVREFIKTSKNKIDKLKKQIEDIENESLSEIKELNAIYITHFLTKIPSTYSVYLTDLKIDELIDSENLQVEVSDKNFTYRTLINNYSNYYNQSNSNLNFDFEEIEKDIDSNFTYEERLDFIGDKHIGKIESLKKEIEKLTYQKNQIESWDLKQIFQEVNIDEYLKDFSNNALLRNLILEGYINENYNDYISLFHEVSITKEDFVFERNVKSGINTDFSYNLSKTENLIGKINDKYFDREVILNFDLLDCLANNYGQYSEKYCAIMNLLSNEKERSLEFIDRYIDRKTGANVFFDKILDNWNGFFEYIFNKSTYDNEKKYYCFEKIILNKNLESLIKKQNEKIIKQNIEKNVQYLYNYEKLGSPIFFKAQIEILLELLKIKIVKVEIPDDSNKSIFELIYNKHYYKLTAENLLLFLRYFNEDNRKIDAEKSNFQAILHSSCKSLKEYVNSSINAYVEDVYLKIEDNRFEDEQSLLILLNNKDLDLKLKSKIIEKVDTKISDLSKIDNIGVKKILLNANKLVPIWKNVVDFFDKSENKIDQNLISYLELEDVKSELSKQKLLKDYEKFEGDFLICNDIDDETFNKLLASCYFGWNKLSFEELNSEKVNELTDKILTTTKSNYDLLRENFKNNHIRLIERNFSKFINDINNFETDDNDKFLILNSNKISIDNKFNYISKIDESIVRNSNEISRLVGEIILQKSKIIDLNIESLKIIITNLKTKDERVKFGNLYLGKLTDSELIVLVSNIGRDYKELFVKQHRPTFENALHIRQLLESLKTRNLINSYNIDKKNKNLIRAVANY